MDKVPQQNAAMAERATAASHRLAKQTAALVSVIEGFETGTSGSLDQAAASGRPQFEPRHQHAGLPRAANPPMRRVASGYPKRGCRRGLAKRQAFAFGAEVCAQMLA